MRYFCLGISGGPAPFSSPYGGKYAAPGTTLGDGSFYSPWTLEQALANGYAGDVWLRDGLYQHTGSLSASASAAGGSRCRFRGYPGEWPRLEQLDVYDGTYVALPGRNTGTPGSLNFIMSADNLTFQDMELFVTQSHRGYPGNNQDTEPGGGMQPDTVGAAAIHTIVHDTGTGIFPRGANSAVTYGNVVRNQGYADEIRQHVPFHYINNAMPAKKVFQHNIGAFGFSYGWEIYSSGSEVSNIHMVENVVWRNSAHNDFAAAAATARGYTVGGTSAEVITFTATATPPSQLIKILRNVFFTPYLPNVSQSYVLFQAYDNTTYGDIEISGNWGMAGSGVYGLNRFPTVTMQDNTLWVPVDWETNPTADHYFYNEVATPAAAVTRTLTGNKYYAGGRTTGANRWRAQGGSNYNDLASWQAATGYDSGSTWSASAPPDEVRIFADRVDPHRAIVAIVNHNARASSVNVHTGSNGVTLDTVLVNNQPYGIFYAAEPERGAIASGTYHAGEAISIPMTDAGVGGLPPTPIGATNDVAGYTVVSDLPDRGVFIVRKLIADHPLNGAGRYAWIAAEYQGAFDEMSLLTY